VKRRLALERSLMYAEPKTRTLSEYIADRWSRRSDMVSLVFRTTISVPGSLRRRTSVPAIPRVDNENFSPRSPGDDSHLTMLSGQIRQPFPEWDAKRKIQEVSDNWIRLRSWWIR
jgi:hypothetical protein